MAFFVSKGIGLRWLGSVGRLTVLELRKFEIAVEVLIRWPEGVTGFPETLGR